MVRQPAAGTASTLRLRPLLVGHPEGKPASI
jgi:hypothetical protein